MLLSEMTAQQVSPKISCLLFLDPKAAKAQLRGDFSGEGCRVLFCFYAIGQVYNWALSLQTKAQINFSSFQESVSVDRKRV